MSLAAVGRMRLLRTAISKASISVVVVTTTLGFVIACSSGGGSTGPAPVLDGEVVSPISGAHVRAAIASASIGDETCAKIETASIRPLSCAMPADGGFKGTGQCGGPCRATTIVLDLKVDGGTGSAHLKIASVELLDSSGSPITTLTASTPERWDDGASTYRAWDETLGDGTTAKARYTISPPHWSTLGSPSSQEHELRITIDVDGARVPLTSSPMKLEPLAPT